VFQEVGTMKSLHWRWEMRFDCVERKRRAKLPASATAPRAFRCRTIVPGMHACVICTFCMCVCVYVYVCTCADMYICIYMHVYVFVHLCIYTHVYAYVYAYLCIDCGSQYQCFSVWMVSCMRMCFRVHMYAYTYVCRCIYMCIFLQRMLHTLYRRFGH